MRAESDTLAQLPRTLPAWRAPEPENRVARRRAAGRRPRPTSARAGARATTRPRSTSGSRRPTLSGDDAVVEPYEIAEPFVHGDARHMDAIDDGSVALVVTSPPYFAGKQYEEELERDGVPSSYVEYLQLLTDVFAECARKLEPGGRIAVNVANLGRKPYRSLAGRRRPHPPGRLSCCCAARSSGARARARPAAARGARSAAPANPVLRDTTERVVIASKGRFDRALSRADRERRGLPSMNTIDADEFMAATLDVWDIEPESARRVSHPAPFPVGLPGRLIDLYTYENDLVLDPFMGSGSTLVAAARLGRRYVGYDLDPTYVDIARLRVRDEGTAAPRRPRRRARRRPTTSTTPTTSKRARPRKARPRRRSPRSCSPTPASRSSPRTSGCRGTGVTINFIAKDADDVEWYFDVSGAFTSTRGGLLRTDTVWKTLGRAHVLRGEAATDRSCSSRRTSRGRAARATSRCKQRRRAGRLLRRDRDALGRGLRAAAQVRGRRALGGPPSGFLA